LEQPVHVVGVGLTDELEDPIHLRDRVAPAASGLVMANQAQGAAGHPLGAVEGVANGLLPPLLPVGHLGAAVELHDAADQRRLSRARSSTDVNDHRTILFAMSTPRPPYSLVDSTTYPRRS